MRNLALIALALACAALLSVALYLRLNETGGVARVVLLIAALALAVMSVGYAGRFGGGRR
ncbi:hypothetical protein [Thermoleophilum album]|uniref:Uncharacterized protein n=1 Tax=Thermoleophilum album TaxID=29539 RepID=A0A1H6FZH1_THEAL|nr:hypothetical protein [Thermoleophilum album]SEH16206.1 hypothetical protein SAMN02745716_2113 [Thermoleophilum album]